MSFYHSTAGPPGAKPIYLRTIDFVHTLQARNQAQVLVGKRNETPFYLQFKLFLYIYPHKGTNVVNTKIET